MKSESLGSRLSSGDRLVLFAVVGASALVWIALVCSLVGIYGVWPELGPARVAAATGDPTLLVTQVPSSTPLSTPPATSTPQPTATPVVLPSPTATVIPTPERLPSGVLAVPIREDTTVVALLGIDTELTDTLWRTDTILLAFIEREAKRIAILSLPRDLWVSIPGHGHGRINTVDALGERTQYEGGGPALLNETMHQNLGISIDHWVRIDFDGFVRVIDAMGGVTIEVKKPISDHFPDPLSPSGWAWITLTAGPRHMDGRMALSYSRSRMTTSDFDRSERQQDVLMALWRQAFTVETLAMARQLWAEFGDSLETDLNMVQAVQLAYYVYGIGVENVHAKSLSVTTARPWTTAGGAQVLLPDTQAIREIVMDLLYGADEPS